MKNQRPKALIQRKPATPFPAPDRLLVPEPVSLPSNVPVKHSLSQPLSLGIELDTKSVLRDILEGHLPANTIKKVR